MTAQHLKFLIKFGTDIFIELTKVMVRRHSVREIRISIIIVVFAVIIFIVTAPIILKNMNKENMTYKIVDTSDKINGKVIGIYDDKGFAFITLSDSTKVCFPHSRNYSYKNPYIHTFILTGDSIVKCQDSDSLKIFRKNSFYYFIIGKFINQKK